MGDVPKSIVLYFHVKTVWPMTNEIFTQKVKVAKKPILTFWILITSSTIWKVKIQMPSSLFHYCVCFYRWTNCLQIVNIFHYSTTTKVLDYGALLFEPMFFPSAIGTETRLRSELPWCVNYFYFNKITCSAFSDSKKFPLTLSLLRRWRVLKRWLLSNSIIT